MADDTEAYDTIETPAAWLWVCDVAGRAYHWFHRLVWCRRGKHAWVDTDTCTFVQARGSDEFCWLRECEHCDECLWMRLAYPFRSICAYGSRDEAMAHARLPSFASRVREIAGK